MIRILRELPDGIFGIEASGKVSHEEADEVMLAFADLVSRHYDVALLLDFAPGTKLPKKPPDFVFNIRLEFHGPVQRLALVAGPQWHNRYEQMVEFLGCEGRHFLPGQRDEAIAWLQDADWLAGPSSPDSQQPS